MRIAGGANPDEVMEVLRQQRPVFHSEADFQHALAWHVQRVMPTTRVRLETRPRPGVRLDLLVVSVAGTSGSAFELKYLTRGWAGVIDGERFDLKNQGAQDIRAYDVVKDIARIEQHVALMSHCNGAVVVVSNVPAYWIPPSHDRETNASSFRLYDGRQLDGVREWGHNTGAGTLRGRELPITLAGAHELRWRDYSRVPGANGLFRMLIVPVDGGGMAKDRD